MIIPDNQGYQKLNYRVSSISSYCVGECDRYPTGGGMTITASPVRPGPLISMPEIAELAAVQRPVVTTWRRRHRDFPVPVGGNAARPLFDARQVADWLVRTGRAAEQDIGLNLYMHTLAALSPMLPARERVAVITALICLRRMDEDEPLGDGTADVTASLRSRAMRQDPDDQFLAAEVCGQQDLDVLAGAVDDLVEASWGCSEAFELVLRERTRFRAAELFADAVTPSLAGLMAGLSGAREMARIDRSLVICDPAAGPGDLLVAVADLLGLDHAPMFTGAEGDPYLVRLVRRRLLAHGIPAVDLDVRLGADLPDETGDPDVIITQIPYQPSEKRSAADVLTRIGDVAVRLSPGRTAVVLGPANVLATGLTAYSPAERQRAELLKGGMLEAVISLPGGLVPFRPGYQPALWVLTSAFSSPWAGRVLLADVSDRTLTPDVVAGLIEDVITWRRDGYQPPEHARQFSTEELIGDLIDQPGPLLPRRPRSTRSVTSTAHARVARITEVQADLTSLAADAAAAPLPVISSLVAGSLRPPDSVTIGALADRKRLIMVKGTRLRDDDLAPEGNHAVIRPEEVLGHSHPGEVRIDRAVLAARYPHAQLTEPGDVVVTTAPSLAAIVDEAGFSVVGFPARALRIPAGERARFTPRVLAALIGASSAGSRPTGAIRPARRLEDLQLSVIRAADLARLDALLQLLEVRQQAAQHEIDLLTELRKITTAGLADGTLTFTGDPGPTTDTTG